MTLQSAVTLALDIPPHQGYLSSLAVIAPESNTYVVPNSCPCSPSPAQPQHTLPSPFNLDRLLATCSTLSQIIALDDGTIHPIPQTPKTPPVQYANVDLLARGAAIAAGRHQSKVSQNSFGWYKRISVSVSIGIGGDLLAYRILKADDKVGDVIITTVRDDQTEVRVPVYVGDRPRAADNMPFTSVILPGIPKAKAGSLKILVSMSASWGEERVALMVQLVEMGSGLRTAKTVKFGPAIEEGDDGETKRRKYKEYDDARNLLESATVVHLEQDRETRNDLEKRIRNGDVLFNVSQHCFPLSVKQLMFPQENEPGVRLYTDT